MPSTGVQHIRSAFARAHAQGRAAFMPYQMLGHPTVTESPQVIRALAAAGADLFELGLPFSDPLADGPTIQAAAQQALENGVTMADCLRLLGRVRRDIPHQALCLMSYVNPILAYGLERFVSEAAAAGADGLIVPDLPPDEPEAGELTTLCHAHGIAPIHLLAPTSTAERIELVVRRSQAFVYLVSVTGITGARDALPSDLGAFVERVRTAVAQLPSDRRPYLAVGFGISSPQLAAEVAQVADGVIVGSALVKLAQTSSEPVRAVAALGATLAAAARLPG